MLLTRTKPRVPAVNRLEGRALGVMAARNRQDQGIVALEFAEPARCARVIGQLIVRKNASGYEVVAYDCIPSTDAIGSMRRHAIRSTHWLRQAGASNGSAKYCVSRATLSPLNSMMLTV